MFKFTKMHALGNDFVVIDGVDQAVSFEPTQAKSIADRHTGIGCDQILLVNGSSADIFEFRIYNADGSESAQCGNGARCVARLLHDRGYPTKEQFVLKTTKDALLCDVSGTEISVALGTPKFSPPDIPFVADSEQLTYELSVGDESVEMSALSIGNPHAVLCVDDVVKAPVLELGPQIERHQRFPERTNVEFMECVSGGKIKLRVFERGVGETFACGSGASAAVIAGIRQGLLDSLVEVELASGSLYVEWEGGETPVFLAGPTSYVYEGRWIVS